MEAGVVDKDLVADLDAQFASLLGRLDELPLGRVQDCSIRWKSQLDAVEARRLAADVAATGDDSIARRKAARGGRRSKAAARKIAKRAAAAAKNPGLLDDLDDGGLSSEQLDVIAGAAADDPAAATDTKFIEGVKKRNIDQGRRLARERKRRGRDGEAEHDRQRRLRQARKFKDLASGLSVLQLEGDDATVDELYNLINLREQQLHAADGGRDLPGGRHGRSFAQRLFDATADLIRGTTAGTAAGGRPAIVITVGVDGNARAVGSGPVPDDHVRQLLQQAQVSVQIVDNLTRQPLWWGRLKRNATTDQFIALVTRDGGCVQCGTNWLRCHAHHQRPWTAPVRGETNIDELALLCVSCHHTLHAANLTLTQGPDGVWTTRPATLAETPPARAGTASRSRRRPDNQPPPAEQSPSGITDLNAQTNPSTTQSRPEKRPQVDTADDEAA